MRVFQSHCPHCGNRIYHDTGICIDCLMKLNYKQQYYLLHRKRKVRAMRRKQGQGFLEPSRWEIVLEDDRACKLLIGLTPAISAWLQKRKSEMMIGRGVAV